MREERELLRRGPPGGIGAPPLPWSTGAPSRSRWSLGDPEDITTGSAGPPRLGQRGAALDGLGENRRGFAPHDEAWCAPYLLNAAAMPQSTALLSPLPASLWQPKHTEADLPTSFFAVAS